MSASPWAAYVPALCNGGLLAVSFQGMGFKDPRKEYDGN